jgi:hypothetical protein
VRSLRLAILVVVVLGVAGAQAIAGMRTAPTISKCARLQLKAPPFKHSLPAATVACLLPRSIRTTTELSWTTCPTTPLEEPCAEGKINLTFRSTAPGFGKGRAQSPDSWGGENYPGAGLFSLPGRGTYRCEGYNVDRQQGRVVYEDYTTTQPLRDQAAGFAVVGKQIKVATSVHPGERGPLGPSAAVRLGQPGKCILAGLPIGPDAVRAAWPGKLVSVASLGGASATVSSAGSFTLSYPVPASEGASPGVEIEVSTRWSSTVVAVSALKR